MLGLERNIVGLIEERVSANHHDVVRWKTTVAFGERSPEKGIF